MKHQILKITLSVIFIGFFLQACSQSNSGTAELQKIVIVEESALLTQAGQRQRYTVQGYDQFGQPMDATVEWQGTHQSEVYVDPFSGEVEAISIGSTVITAHVGDISSAPVTAIFAQLRANVVAIEDDQVVTTAALIPAPNGDRIFYEVGIKFQVTLNQLNAAPGIGQILFNQGKNPFLGRVVESSPASSADEFILTMEVIGLDDLFEKLEIDEDIPLKHVAVDYNDLTLEYFTVTENADGSITLDPKPTVNNPVDNKAAFTTPPYKSLQKTDDSYSKYLSVSPAVGTRANAFAPFDCTFTGPFNPANTPFKLGAGDSKIEFSKDISIPFVYSAFDGLEKLAVRGAVKAAFSSKVTVTLAVEAKISCQYTIGRIFIPLPGLIGLVVGGNVPFGIGLDVGGKLKLADTGYEVKAEASLQAEYGYYHPPLCDSSFSEDQCGFLGTAESNSNTELKLDLLNADTPSDDISLEPAASAYGFAKIGFANKFFPVSKSVDLVELRAGATLGANLATVNGQINDSTTINYKSDYKLTLDVLAKPGATVEKALSFFKVVSFGKFEIKHSELLTSSPGSAKDGLIVDQVSFETGDELLFSVTLDETTVNFLPLIYNVKSVKIYEKAATADAQAKLIASQQANDGQLQFDLSWISTHNGSTSGQFYAFVETSLLPIPVFGDLELGVLNATAGGIEVTTVYYVFDSGAKGGISSVGDSDTKFGNVNINYDASGQTGLGSFSENTSATSNGSSSSMSHEILIQGGARSSTFSLQADGRAATADVIRSTATSRSKLFLEFFVLDEAVDCIISTNLSGIGTAGYSITNVGQTEPGLSNIGRDAVPDTLQSEYIHTFQKGENGIQFHLLTGAGFSQNLASALTANISMQCTAPLVEHIPTDPDPDPVPDPDPTPDPDPIPDPDPTPGPMD